LLLMIYQRYPNAEEMTVSLMHFLRNFMLVQNSWLTEAAFFCPNRSLAFRAIQ